MEVTMLKKFLACITNEQRYHFMTETSAGNWDRTEIKVVADILNIESNDDTTVKEFYTAILKKLSGRADLAA